MKYLNKIKEYLEEYGPIVISAVLFALLIVNIISWTKTEQVGVFGAPSSALTYQKSLIPISDNLFDLGTTTKAWRNIYVNNVSGLTGTTTVENLYATGNLQVDGHFFAPVSLVAGGDLDMDGNSILDLGDVTFKTGAQGGTLRTGVGAADKFTLQAYDVNDSIYRTVMELDAGNTVRLQMMADFLEIEDNTDVTKQVTWDVSGATTGTLTDLVFSQTANRTITFPNSTGTLALTSDIPSAGANTALSNLASVAINTSLISDTDSTDDLGSTSISWANLYVDSIKAKSDTSLNILTGTSDTTDNQEIYIDSGAGAGSATRGALFRVSGNEHTLGGDIRAYLGETGEFQIRHGAGQALGFVLDTSGNIGINAATPSEKLEINGNLEFAGTNYIKRDGVEKIYFPSGDIQLAEDVIPTADVSIYLGTSTRRWENFYSAQITDNGTNVGVGTTTPSGKLHVVTAGSGNVNFDQADSNTSIGFLNGFTVNNTDATTNNYIGILFGDNSASAAGASGGIGMQLTDRTNHYGDFVIVTRGTGGYTEKLRIDSDGNVGIGSLSPSAKLEIADASVASFRLNDTGGSANNKLTQIQQNGDLFQVRAYNDSGTGKHVFFLGDNSTGFVGIATSTPAYGLDLYSSFRIDNGQVVLTPKALTDGATINIDWSLGNKFYVTLGDNRTLTFSNISVGQSITVYVTQDGTGSRTLTQPTVAGPAITLSTGAGVTDILVYSTATSTATVHARFSAGE